MSKHWHLNPRTPETDNGVALPRPVHRGATFLWGDQNGTKTAEDYIGLSEILPSNAPSSALWASIRRLERERDRAAELDECWFRSTEP